MNRAENWASPEAYGTPPENVRKEVVEDIRKEETEKDVLRKLFPRLKRIASVSTIDELDPEMLDDIAQELDEVGVREDSLLVDNIEWVAKLRRMPREMRDPESWEPALQTLALSVQKLERAYRT